MRRKFRKFHVVTLMTALAAMPLAVRADPAFEMSDVLPVADVTTVLAGALVIVAVFVFYKIVTRKSNQVGGT